MKKLNLLATAIMMFGMCFALQTVSAQTETEKKLKALKERRALAQETKGLLDEELEADTRKTPCTLYDDDEWYTAFNQKEGRRGDAKLATSLLEANQQQLKLKIKGRYQAVVRDYFDQMDVDNQSTAASHIESAGEMVIEQFLDDTREYCRKETLPDERGNIIMYMSIRIRKKELVDKVATELSKDKESGIRFNEAKFRESALKVFEEN